MKLCLLVSVVQTCLLAILIRASTLSSQDLTPQLSLQKTVRAGSCFAAFVTCPSTRVSNCAAGSSSTTACPARQVSDNDNYFYDNLKAKAGDREFFLPMPTTGTALNNIQSTGVSFALTYDALHPRLIGSRTYTPIGPPGWDEFPSDSRQRGHLWAKDLGGSGTYYLNVITLSSQVNQEMNNVFECKVKEAFELMDLDKLSTVFVTILVRYNSNAKASKKVFLFADVEYYSSGGWVKEPWLGMEIKNKKGEKAKRLFPDRTSTIKSASKKMTADSSCTNQRTVVNTLSFIGYMSQTNNDWWTFSQGAGGPRISMDDGELWFFSDRQSIASSSATITSKRQYPVNSGLSFRFQFSPYRFYSSETTLEFAGGIALQFRSGASPTWNKVTGSTFTRLATSSMTSGPGWYDIHVVYTRTRVILWERGVKKFDVSNTIGSFLPFKATFKNSDINSKTAFKISNVAVHESLF
ncbi:unnamed protein product [Agarophyton chilense]|eukprot:gb/GEZJ01002244.1/.p1 GENE.gb/GEZJ01002244.1/~~gb/GEZJ01002244.1/.p1  ORF type:complete len:466 (-),score=35.32 gb/GEZJ01002244.1/:2903-4300(-)